MFCSQVLQMSVPIDDNGGGGGTGGNGGGINLDSISYITKDRHSFSE